MTKNSKTIYTGRVVEAFLDTVEFSLFTTMEVKEYLKSKKAGVLDFEVEVLKPFFQADWYSIDKLLRRFFDESETEIGITHFYAFEKWTSMYVNEYFIDHEGRADILKIAYGTG